MARCSRLRRILYRMYRATALTQPHHTPWVATEPLSQFRQDFRLIETLADATNWIEAVSWSAQLLAVGGQDMMVRIYDSAQDVGARKGRCRQQTAQPLQALKLWFC